MRPDLLRRFLRAVPEDVFFGVNDKERRRFNGIDAEMRAARVSALAGKVHADPASLRDVLNVRHSPVGSQMTQS